MNAKRSIFVLILVVSTLSIGCLPGGGESKATGGDTLSSDGASASGAAGTASDEAGGAKAEPEIPPKCERQGFSNADVTVKRIKDGLKYVAEIDGENGRTKMEVTVYQSQDFIGPTSPGEYSLDGVNYRDCGLCPVIYADIDGETNKPRKTFYADRGRIDFSEIEGGTMKGAFKDVVFYEVDIAQNDFTSTRIKDGETWCFDTFAMEGEDPNAPPPPNGGGGGGSMGPGSVGNQPPDGVCERDDIACIGEVVGDFELLNCETGEMMSISKHFENGKAGWLVLTTEWCPGCSNWVPQVAGFHKDADENDLKVAYILGENKQYAQPSLNECKAYGARYGVPQGSMFIDHNGEDSFRWTFARLWPYVGANGSFGLPFNAVLNATTKEYVYADKGPVMGSPLEWVRQLMGL